MDEARLRASDPAGRGLDAVARRWRPERPDADLFLTSTEIGLVFARLSDCRSFTGTLLWAGRCSIGINAWRFRAAALGRFPSAAADCAGRCVSQRGATGAGTKGDRP